MNNIINHLDLIDVYRARYFKQNRHFFQEHMFTKRDHLFGCKTSLNEVNILKSCRVCFLLLWN